MPKPDKAKRAPGRPPSESKMVPVLISFPPAMLKEIDRWRDKHPVDFEEMSRSAAMRALIARGLKAKD
jgi:hypothetical protein